jgi:hypothetical protein
MPDQIGPLFIVGMPRSGTKLLRDLLNQHPLISIPDVESHFIPYMVKQFGEQLQIKTPEKKELFYDVFCQTAFYFNNVRKGRLLSKEDFVANCDFTNWSSVFKFITLYYSPKDNNLAEIWGDKTPSYLNQVKLLKRMFPNAKFIHIIRDPRDYCLSARKIWKKNIFRAAVKWQKIMKKAMEYPALLGPDYIEVYYEELTRDPQKVLTNICSFLDIHFTAEMLSVKKSNEFYGDARGSKEIILNSKKFMSELKDSEISKIEALTIPVISHFGYEVLHKVNPMKLSKSKSFLYKLEDVWNQYLFQVNEKGFIKGTVYTIKLSRNNLDPAND